VKENGYCYLMGLADPSRQQGIAVLDEPALAQAFHEQVECWKHDTGHFSSLTRRIAHPSYLRIIGMAGGREGRSADRTIERLLLLELQSEPDHWFSALTAITGEDPVRPEDDFDEAVNAWLEWGRKKGII